MLQPLLDEVRIAARGLWRSPGFAATAMATLALGIGATTVVFSVVYHVLLQPLPFPTADRLVRVVQLFPANGRAVGFRSGLTPPQIAEWRATSRTLAEIGFSSPSAMTLSDLDVPVRMTGAAVSVSLFRALGVPASLGRTFVDDDAEPGNERVVLLSDRVWRTLFGADPAVVGRRLMLNERSFEIIGIMPESFGFPSMAHEQMSLNSAGELADAPEYWTPLVATPRPAGPATSGMTLVPTYALLAEGVSVAQATAEVNTLMPSREGDRNRVEVIAAHTEESSRVRPMLLVFQAAVALVLLMASINVVNLLLARSAVRRNELLLRLALGASRGQVIRATTVEGVLIGLGGGILGVTLAYMATQAIRTLPPFLLPRIGTVTVDEVVLAVASIVAVAAGAGVGLVSALRTLRYEHTGRSAAWSGRTVSAGRHQRPSFVLLVVETAGGVVLLAGAALLLTSFVRLANVERGFSADGVYTFRVNLPVAAQTPAAQADFHRQFTAGLQAVPGVQSVALSDRLLGQSAIGFSLAVRGETLKEPVHFNAVAPGMFHTLAIPLRGRDFSTTDFRDQAQVAIVNETFARKFFPGENPIGQQIGFQRWSALEIIGIAGDSRLREVNTAVPPAIYLPPESGPKAVLASSLAASTYVVRAANHAILAPAVRQLAAGLNAGAVVFDAMPLETLLARSVIAPKAYSWVAGVFAGVALLLAALGLYGVVSYAVGARTREFGIRLVLGATPREVMVRAMREGLLAVFCGLVLGWIGAVYASRFLVGSLFGVEPGDPRVLAAVSLLFIGVAIAATLLPARRATRVDPVRVLSAE